MILATRWTAKGHTKEPQREKKGVRALIDSKMLAERTASRTVLVLFIYFGRVGDDVTGFAAWPAGPRLAAPFTSSTSKEAVPP